MFSFCLIVACFLCCPVVSPTPPPPSSLPESPAPHLSTSHKCRPLLPQSRLSLPPFLKVDCCISMTGLDDRQHCHFLLDQSCCCRPLRAHPTIGAATDKDVHNCGRGLCGDCDGVATASLRRGGREGANNSASMMCLLCLGCHFLLPRKTGIQALVT